jgi:hypothetical protein
MFEKEKFQYTAEKQICEMLKSKFGGKVKGAITRKGNYILKNNVGKYTWYSDYISILATQIEIVKTLRKLDK